jgi:hypothetical protein
MLLHDHRDASCMMAEERVGWCVDRWVGMLAAGTNSCCGKYTAMRIMRDG